MIVLNFLMTILYETRPGPNFYPDQVPDPIRFTRLHKKNWKKTVKNDYML